MIELTDVVREKLNDPEIIKKMSEYLLLNFGKFNFDVSQDGHSPFPEFFGLRYSLCPNLFRGNKFWVLGESNFLDKDNKLVSDFLRNDKILEEYSHPFKYSKFEGIIASFFNAIAKNPLSFSSVRVYTAKTGKKDDGDFRVFEYDRRNFSIFKKGEWQKYLAECYISSLKLDRNAKNILL